LPRQILWRIHSRQAVLCAGATERPIAFENNDRPGIMLAGAMRAYVNRWAAAAGTRIAVFTNNDDGHRTARDMLAKGVDVVAVVDVRPDAPRTGDYELLAGARVVDTGGRLGLKEIQVRLADGSLRQISCGALGVSGGWNPAVSLTSHQRGRPVWQDDIVAFVPGPSLPVGMSVAGAANGRLTTLGKVDVQGADAAQFLNKVYCNGFAKLPVGKVRYGLMLREDGMAMDDGTAARLAEDHFVVTTTTANAVGVYRHMEFVRQCLCPDLDVQLISTTEAWAQYAVAGPNSRALLQKIVDPEFDLSSEGFRFMACGEITICGGVRARLFRISFSGELAYELAVPARYGDNLMRALMTAGKDFNVTPYGTEALGVLRIEKGHAAGNELNGQTSAAHLGMGRMVSTKKDSIGAVLSRREALSDADGWRLVGLEAVEADVDLPAGGHLFERGKPHQASNDQGWITSAAYSPHLEKSIALGYLLKGDQRFGEEIEIANPIEGATHKAKVVSPHFIDPEGERLRA
jgi:glycine cleavage system aminomethyltransferase T